MTSTVYQQHARGCLRSFTQHQGQAGFTIVELMLVLAIGAIILGLAVPAYQGTIRRNAILAETSRLQAAINYARAQAVSLGQVVTIRSTSATANDWSGGWTIYNDVDGVGNAERSAANDTLFKDVDAAAQVIDIVSNATGYRYISFNDNGTLREGGGSITLEVCDKAREETGRQLSISAAGLVTVAEVTADNCG